MKLPTPPPEHDDEDATTGKAKPPVDPLFVAQQKHRLAERLAILSILAGCSGKPDSATLTKIRLRWDTGILNQLHVGKWDSIWPLLDAVHDLPGFDTGGIVIFGGWHASPPEDANDLTEPPKDLLDLLADFRVYSITLELIARLNASGTVGDYCKRNAEFKGWIERHRARFGFLATQPDDIEAIERVAKQAVDEFPPLIHNLLLTLACRVFVFLPLPGDASAGWRSLYEFGDAYRRLPRHIINEFGDYFFEVSIPSAGAS